MRSAEAFDDWTASWSGTIALLLSSRTREPNTLATPASARLLELALELAVIRHRQLLHGYVVMPSALHLVGAVGPAETELSWPVTAGRAKGAFARWWNELGHRSGAVWSEHARVRPLTTIAAVRSAVEACHDLPVRTGLVRQPRDYPFSSWRLLYGTTVPSFVKPVEPE